jgi:hypothetical protein
LSLRLDTFNENILLRGYANDENYIRVSQREQLIITCTKPYILNGTILAFVNTRLATTIKCLHYSNDLMIGDESFCQSKQFIFYIEPDQNTFVDIKCRLAEIYLQDSLVNLFLLRLCKRLAWLGLKKDEIFFNSVFFFFLK